MKTKSSITYLVFFLVSIMISHRLQSQGCIAVRHMACATGGIIQPNVNTIGSSLNGEGFQFTAGYRYLHSYKHFVGKEEQVQRVIDGTDVRNYSHSIDLGLSYSFNDHFTLTGGFAFFKNAQYEGKKLLLKN